VVLAEGDGPLLVSGPPRSGKTHSLLARVARLCSEGAAVDSVLVLSPSRNEAAALRTRLREHLQSLARAQARPRAYVEPAVLTPEAFCAGLLRALALQVGLDPFFVVATKADRLAMLLAHAEHQRLARSRPRNGHAIRIPRRPGVVLRAIERIDRLKGALIDADRYAAWAAACGPLGDPSADAARDFAELYLVHERLLDERGALDAGELLLRTCSLPRGRGDARLWRGSRYSHLVIDDFEDSSAAWVTLVERLASEVSDLTLAGDEHQLAGFCSRHPAARVAGLAARTPGAARIRRAAGAVLEGPVRSGGERELANAAAESALQASGELGFWRCSDERAQTQCVVADIERVIGHAGAFGEARHGLSRLTEGGSSTPERTARVAVVVRSLTREGRSLAAALKDRAIPYRVIGASEFFERAEVRDLLAWMRLLRDPLDSHAAIRLLMRAPVELRPGELARVIRLARRRKLDMPSALAAAIELAQLPPEATERIGAFLELHEELVSAFEQMRPDQLVHRLIERTGLRRARVLATGAEAVEGLVGLSRVEELASHFVQFAPEGSADDFADYLAAAAEAGLPLDELASSALDAGAQGDAGAHGDSAVVQLVGQGGAPGNDFDQVYILGLAGGRTAGRSGISSGELGGGVPAELLAERLPADTELRPHGDLRRSLALALSCARQRAVLVYAAQDAEGLAQAPLAAAEDARAAARGEWEDRVPQPLEVVEALQASVRVLRQRVLEDVILIGARLGELRLDTDQDISRGVVHYLELLKLASLLERSQEQSLTEALPDLNARLLSACTPLQREIFESSTLDREAISGLARGGNPVLGSAIGETSEDALLAAFLPRRGEGLVLSASDIETYRACPLRYKLARVLRIPAAPTPQQRFGIMVHKVLERYHSGWDRGSQDKSKTLATLMRLLDAAWRRAGFGESPAELSLLAKARTALTRYHGQLAEQSGRPVWFERPFSFAVGPHLVRGRVDRVDRIPDGGYELIDYKTGHPKTPVQLEDDIQLALYALAARRAWNVTAPRQAYYYVLDNRKVPLASQQGPAQLTSVANTIAAVGSGILGLQFEPTPSYSVCAACDYLTVCPAAES
jgi:DNA helicase II / ATP-dependent DNA helicase PcrA